MFILHPTTFPGKEEAGPLPRQAAMRSPLAMVYDRESLSAVDGLVPDLQPQPSSFEQPAELVVLGRVVRMDAKQKLPIIRVKKGLCAQGGRVRPDSQVVTLSQAAPELIDMGLVELPELLPLVRQLAADD